MPRPSAADRITAREGVPGLVFVTSIDAKMIWLLHPRLFIITGVVEELDAA